MLRTQAASERREHKSLIDTYTRKAANDLGQIPLSLVLKHPFRLEVLILFWSENLYIGIFLLIVIYVYSIIKFFIYTNSH